ncbi:MAG: RuBisCO large subunit C-terminal-like domain-containing protein [bacterium]
MNKGLIVTYCITCPPEEVRDQAEALALEQSVELPHNAVTDPEVAQSSIPDILELTPISRMPNGLTRHRVRLAFSPSLVGGDIPQFFNLLFGNISLKKGVRVEDIDMPVEMAGVFPGPAHGMEGVRKACRRPSGAILCSVLKPVGSSTEVFAGMAEAFARAGVPFIKDDHGLADQPASPFAKRVASVQTAIKRAGERSVYLPNITGPHEDLQERIAMALNEGVKGFLVCPFLIGLDTFRFLRQRYPVLWMAHPAFSGEFFADPLHGFRPGLLLGTILRLLGADMVVFPDAGGRFAFTPDECRDIASGLRDGYQGAYRRAMPVPAGGISLARVHRVRRFYGDDVMLLIGGDIYLHESGLERASRELMEILSKPTEPAPDTNETGTPRTDVRPYRACSLPEGVTRQARAGEWEGIRRSPYKVEGGMFQGITRTELYVPESGEAGFDVRYFEIEPKGFSSLERHEHIHLVIGVRGTGEVRIADTWHTLSPHDIVRIPRGCPHQLRNRGTSVFGFYCIVDHVRDRPEPLQGNDDTP